MNSRKTKIRRGKTPQMNACVRSNKMNQKKKTTPDYKTIRNGTAAPRSECNCQMDQAV